MKLYMFFVLLFVTSCAMGQKINAINIVQLRQDRIDSIKTLLNIKTGDKIADVGSGDGINLIKLIYPNNALTIYAEDIDSSKCNRKDFKTQLDIYKSNLPIDSFHFVYGNENSTLLPRQYFDKIFLIAVIHEFNYRDAMLADIKSTLNKNGEILIEEPLVKKHVPKDKGCNNPYLTEPELFQILNSNHIHIKKKVAINSNSGLHNYFRKAYLCTLD